MNEALPQAILRSAFFVSVFLALATASADDLLENVTAESLYDINKEEPWRYLLYLPEGYDVERQKKWPLFIWLHGRSLRGRDLERVKRYGPPARFKKKADYPFVAVFPQLPDGGWPPETLGRLLDECLEKYHVDPDRVYLSGTSLGAMGAWTFAAEYPDQFAALATVCAHGPLSAADKLTELPIRAFHGAKDKIVPIGPHQQLVDAINEKGGNAVMKVFPDDDHGSVIGKVYDDPELYEWFLSNRRGKEAPEIPETKPTLMEKLRALGKASEKE